MSPWVAIGGLTAAITAYLVWGKHKAYAAGPGPSPKPGHQPYPAPPVQHALSVLGYNVEQTGTYDAQTIAAVKLYQSRNGLAVDGIVGPLTGGKIEQDLIDIGLFEEVFPAQ